MLGELTGLLVDLDLGWLPSSVWAKEEFPVSLLSPTGFLVLCCAGPEPSSIDILPSLLYHTDYGEQQDHAFGSLPEICYQSEAKILFVMSSIHI